MPLFTLKDGATVGIGAGQMSRLDSSRIAARKSKMRQRRRGFRRRWFSARWLRQMRFPVRRRAVECRQCRCHGRHSTGGSIRDDKVIAAADEAGLAMIFTGMRHFGTGPHFRN